MNSDKVIQDGVIPSNTNNKGEQLDTQATLKQYVDVKDFEILKKDYELLKYDFLKLQKEQADARQQPTQTKDTVQENNNKENLDEWYI